MNSKTAASNATSHVDRVKAEQKALAENLAKLNNFLGTDKYLELEYADRELLQKQRDAMAEYNAILEKRIARF